MGKKLPTFWADDVPEALMRAATRQRDRLLMMTMLYAGLRVAELCALRVEDLDFKRGLIWTRQGKGSRDRVAPLAKKLLGPLRGWCGSRIDGYVFPSPRGGRLGTRCVQLMVKRMAVRGKLPNATLQRKYHPHGFRHAYANRLLESGATIYEVQQLLGHASIQTTQHYLSTTPGKLRDAVDRA